MKYIPCFRSSRREPVIPHTPVVKSRSHPGHPETREPSQTRNSSGPSKDVGLSIPKPGAEYGHPNAPRLDGPLGDEQQPKVLRKSASPKLDNGRYRSQGGGSDPELEDKATLKAKKSLGTLRKSFRKYEKDGEFQSQHRDLFDYVQELHLETSNLTKALEMLTKDLDVLNSIFKQVYFIVRKCEPELAQDLQGISFQEMPDYLKNLLTSYKDKLSKLRGQLNKLEIQLREKGEEITNLKITHSNTQKVYEKTVKDRDAGYEDNLRQQKNGFEARFTQQAEEHAATIRDMTGQYETEVSQLQNGLLTTVDGFEPLADSDCAKEINVLRSLVHTLAFQRTAVDSQRLGQSFDQVLFIQSNAERSHKFVLEARIWDIVYSEVFSTPFMVLGQYGATFTASWIQLFRNKDRMNGSAFTLPEPGSRSEMWRYVTFETLKKDLMGTEPLAELRNSYETHKAKTRAAISEDFSRVFPEDKETEIWKIVDKSFSLALEFGIQRCRLQFFAPVPGEFISTQDAGTYVDLNKGNEEGLNQREVQLAIRPGVRRIGDGRGGSFATVANVIPAGVYLGKTI